MMSSSVGHFAPLGATHLGNGWWNFAVYSPRQVLRLAIGAYETCLPTVLIALDPNHHRTGNIWHIRVQVDKERFVWGWEVEPCSAVSARYALDPYAPLLKTGHLWGKSAWETFSSGSEQLLCVAAASPPFPWKTPYSPLRPDSLVIYEAHVRGFTQDPSSRAVHPGTYLGMIEKIPHLKAMGVTAIELLPVYEFFEGDWKLTNPLTGERLFNYWGYSPLSFFSPMQRYGTTSDPLKTAQELKRLVEACHDEGLAVILDVVYNHTGEGNEEGPAYSLKLLDESTYYIKNEDGSFANYSGCGNTLNANHPIVENLILASLRHWVSEYHIDGFRFDLASALTRSQNGTPMAEPPLIEAIIRDPIVGQALFIAEPWDAGAASDRPILQLKSMPPTGFFRVERPVPGRRPPVYQGRRGTCRGPLPAGCAGLKTSSAPLERLSAIGQLPPAHDGLCLYDIVSYQAKHNEPNGEQNRDGMNDNASWNCGVEGPTEKQHVLHLRDRQIKNFLLPSFSPKGCRWCCKETSAIEPSSATTTPGARTLLSVG